MDKRRERIVRFKGNAEYQRKQGDLQECLEFKELAEELEKLEQIEQIINETNRRESVLVNPTPKITVRSMGFDKIKEVLNG